MNGAWFGAVIRRTEAIDRKTSLAVMGGSFAAAAMARPLRAEAKHTNKKCGGCQYFECVTLAPEN